MNSANFKRPANHILLFLGALVLGAVASSLLTWLVVQWTQVSGLKDQVATLSSVNAKRLAEMRQLVAFSVSQLDPSKADKGQEVAVAVAAPAEPVVLPATKTVAVAPSTAAKAPPAASRAAERATPQPPRVTVSPKDTPLTSESVKSAAPAAQVAPAQPTALVAAEATQPSADAAVSSSRPRFTVTFKDAGIKGLDGSAVYFASGRAVRIGERLGSGEKLLEVNPTTGLVVTDQRVIQLRSE